MPPRRQFGAAQPPIREQTMEELVEELLADREVEQINLRRNLPLTNVFGRQIPTPNVQNVPYRPESRAAFVPEYEIPTPGVSQLIHLQPDLTLIEGHNQQQPPRVLIDYECYICYQPLIRRIWVPPCCGKALHVNCALRMDKCGFCRADW